MFIEHCINTLILYTLFKCFYLVIAMEEQYEEEINDMMGIRYTKLERLEISAPRVQNTQALVRDIFNGTGLSKRNKEIEN